MEDGEKQVYVAKDVSGQPVTDISNTGTILQPIWVRRGSILSDIMDRKFMESQPRYVLYCGILFWSLFLLSKVI
jgi:hypothetical protein